LGDEMNILKRTGKIEAFDEQKIVLAINSAFRSINCEINDQDVRTILDHISEKVNEGVEKNRLLSVEDIGDLVEKELMVLGYHKASKSYILYRENHTKNRNLLNQFKEFFPSPLFVEMLKEIQLSFDQAIYSLDGFYHKLIASSKPNMERDEKLQLIIQSAVELTTKEAPQWEFISARLLNFKMNESMKALCEKLGLLNFSEKIEYLTEQGVYGKYILENYTKHDILNLESYMNKSRDNLLTFSALNLLNKRYLLKTKENRVLETPQEMFMGIAMHLAIPEKEQKIQWAKRIYDLISSLKVTMATPTMSNSRRPYHQLSSCFIDTVPDSLDGIYRSIDNFAKVSKLGGGMGLYFGKVRASGSDIRGYSGVSGGVNRWVKLANDTAVAVDQLGVRQGAVAVYLDVWHKDLLEFLQLKTNNGDDRVKAHDVFPGVCFPDLFWRLARDDRQASWSLFCPHEIQKIKGYSLEDSFGETWEKRYKECVEDQRISRKEVAIIDVVRLIIKSVFETGTPFVFNRDIVNRMNPNSDKGMVYCTNLCTEIIQNMSPIESISTEIQSRDGETVVVTKTKPGDFVVCNLASLVLGNINFHDEVALKEDMETVVRAVDNVIDLNFYPTPYAEVTNKKYRAIGIGTSGYHHLLAKNGIPWESDQHVQFADEVYEKINYYCIRASHQIAKEKGAYLHFEGSDWHTGDYFSKRNYTSDRWNELREEVQAYGVRNGYIMAVAPTGSTSIIAGTTAAIDPVMKQYFLEEKKGTIIPRVAPELNLKTVWLYKSAYNIDQEWVVRLAGVRQRHIDQSQSLNLYIRPDFTMKQILDLYTKAWEYGVKTVYYVRSQSLEVEECESCSS
jgi:ribonucleoside-diphosphate reductase alpha chain